MPVSWQIGPSSSAAMSMFEAMMFSACDDCVPGVSCFDRDRHGRAHIGRQIGGGLGDQFEKTAFQELHWENQTLC